MNQTVPLKDHSREQSLFLSRVIASAVIVLLLTFVLVGRLYQLQVVEYEQFADMSQGNRLRIDNTDEAFTVDLPLFPTNHWNAQVLGQDRVLSTLTGRVNEVRIQPQGRETVATERGDLPATRYTYTGDLETEIWYDDAGRWVKMRFEGRDRSTIEYVCRRCQGGSFSKAEN